MRIFDVHTHVWPDSIAVKVVEQLRERSGHIPAYTDGTAGDLRNHALAAGYTGWMNCPVMTHPGQAHAVNEKVAAKQSWPALSMGGIHPADEDVVGELSHIRDLGLQGIKLHPEYQEFCPLEKRMEVIWSECESHGMPVIIHAGNDIGFKPPYHSTPGDFAEVKRRHPGLTLICAHMGGWLVWDRVFEELAGSDVYFDTSFTTEYIPFERFEQLIKLHGTDKILFGTDSPWTELAGAVKDIEALSITDAEREAILWGNAANIWKLDSFLEK